MKQRRLVHCGEVRSAELVNDVLRGWVCPYCGDRIEPNGDDVVVWLAAQWALRRRQEVR